ncbi:5'-deoxyadenosine deaminase [Salidesulfovibrio onnuriiensis]|uniref:5'-deoxyadenosine deaminase n=1 Tax=Salidesulfovibrio onnuriiensis TaxID=2583823 RepID=UPI0011C740C5|nr:5'-deoxyadenosine deaminase [Salidesulfovibrio onnuriiensis]
MTSILIKNGTVVTMNPGREILRETDIYVENDRIREIGPGLAHDADEVIDATGRIVIPGLIQTHIHLTQTLFRGLADDLELMDWLKMRIWPLEAAHAFETNAISARIGIAEMLMGGTTCILDMGTVNHFDAIAETVRDTGFRAFLGKCMMDHGDEVPAGLMEDTQSSLRESVAALEKWHESANGRIKYAFAPRFVVSCTEKLMLKVQEMSDHHGVMIHTHASENRGEIALVEQERGMRNILYLDKIGMAHDKLVLAHCIWLDEEEKRIIADKGIRVAHCPSCNMKLASGIAEIPELLAMGASVSIGADGAPCNNNLDMFREMRHAALLQKVRLLSPTAMPADMVLELATLGGARALHMEDELGSIEPGKKADLAIVDLNKIHATPNCDRDPVSQLVYTATAQDVTHTLVDGRVLMRERKLTSIDLEQTIADGNSLCMDILKKDNICKLFQ